MNRYSPYHNHDEDCTGMTFDEDGSWVHISKARDLLRERDEARAEMDEFALAVGYGERPEGQSGVHRLHGEQLADRWKQIERELDEARAEVERLREAVRHVHAWAEKGRDWNAVEAIRKIHKITKGMVE